MQGYLAHKKQRPARTLQKENAQGPMVVVGGGVVSYERGTPVTPNHAMRSAGAPSSVVGPALLLRS